MKNKILPILLLLTFNFYIHSIDYKIHYMKDGETLWKLSRLYNISLNDLCKINNIDDVTKVKKGSKIKIPVKNESISKTVKKQEKIYFDYKIPMEGNIKPYVTSHFRGIIIFSDKVMNNVSVIDAGDVSFTGDVSGYGLTVIIKHNNDIISSYSGFKEIYFKQGDKVKKNQVLGIAGNLSRYKKNGILYSIQYKNSGLRFDMEKSKFYRN